jgi:tetratricopeptide (TPR) repeat protein
LWLYVQQILLPLPDSYSLHHDDIPISRGWFDPPSTAFAVLGWILIIGFAVSQRRKRPWMTFAVGWFLAGHLLESSVIGLEIAYEHRNYLPSVGVIFGAAGMLMPVVADARGKLTRLVLAIGTVALCAVVTGVRAAQWGDEYIRTQIESSTHPASARTHYDAARAILDRELPTGEIGTVAYYMARTHFLRAARYDPDNKAALAGILYLDCATGAGKDSNVLKEFLDRLENRRFTNGEQGFIQSLSNILVHDAMCLGAPDIDAVLAAALSNPTARGRTRGMLHAVAMDYAEAGRGSLDQARTHATAAVESDPANAVLRINLIRVLLHLNEIDEAKRQYASLTSLYVPPAARGEVMSIEQLLRATEH